MKLPQTAGQHPAQRLITPRLVKGFCESSQRKVTDKRDVWSELSQPAPNVHANINIDRIFEVHVNCLAAEKPRDSQGSFDAALYSLNGFEECWLSPLDKSPFFSKKSCDNEACAFTRTAVLQTCWCSLVQSSCGRDEIQIPLFNALKCKVIYGKAISLDTFKGSLQKGGSSKDLCICLKTCLVTPWQMMLCK